MSIEVLTRRIERLKHHIQLLDDGHSHSSAGGSPTYQASKGTTTDLAPLKLVVVAQPSRPVVAVRRGSANGLRSKPPPRSEHSAVAVRERLRQQQAATKGVTQIRDELQAQELQLYDTLLEKYVRETLMEHLCGDPQFFQHNNSAADIVSRASSAASSSQAQTPEMRSRASGEDVTTAETSLSHHHPLPAAMAGRPSSPSHAQQQRSSSDDSLQQQSQSIVGLDTKQRNRNAKVEQLAVACQVLISRRRRFDMLDAKMKDVDLAVLRFNEILADCHRLWKKTTASSVYSTVTSANGILASGTTAAPFAQQLSAAQQSRATKLAPISSIGGGGGRRPSLSPGRSDLTVEQQQPSSSVTPRIAAKADADEQRSNSLKILHAKVNDAQNDIRSAVVRLLLYLNDIVVEVEEQQQQASSQSISGTNAVSSPKQQTISSVVLERKQTGLFEKLLRHCQQIRAAFGDAPEFCPSSLGIICSTPLLMDVSIFSAIENELRGRSTSRSGSGTGDGEIPVAQHRRKSVGGPGAAVLPSNGPEETSPGGADFNSAKRASILAIPRKSISFPQSSTSMLGGRQPLIIPRSVKEAEAQGIQRAHETWLTLANLIAVDIPPTSVPYSKRHVPVVVAAAAATTTTTTAQFNRPSTPNMFLARHQQQQQQQLGHHMNDTHDYFARRADTPEDVDTPQQQHQQQQRNRRTSITVEESVIAAAAEAAIAAISSQPPSPLRPRSSLSHRPEETEYEDTRNAAYPVDEMPVGWDNTTTNNSMHVSAITFADLSKVTEGGDDGNATLPAECNSSNVDQYQQPAQQQEQSRNNNEAVRAMWRARRNLQNASSAATHFGSNQTSPVKQSQRSTPSDSFDEPHSDRLQAIAEKLHRLEAQRKLLKFARGFVVDGRGAARKRLFGLSANTSTTTPLIDEISVLSTFEEHLKSSRQQTGDEHQQRDWASEAEVIGLSRALAERDAIVYRREREALVVIVRFLRGVVSSRKNRERCEERRSVRRAKCAVAVIELWWSIYLPQRQAQRHARRHASNLRLKRYNDRVKRLEAVQASIARISNVGRGFIARRLLGSTYPEAMEAIQKDVVRRALWFKYNQKAVDEQRAVHGQKSIRTQQVQCRIRAAIQLQAFARQIAARNRVRNIKSQQLLERRQYGGATIQERLRAARCLQRGWRSYRARIVAAAKRISFKAASMQRQKNASRDWAESRLVGFMSIIEAKRETQRRRRVIAAREKEERRKARDPARRRAEISAALLGAQKRMQDIVSGQTNSLFLAGLGPSGGDSSAIAQRQIQRILKIDHSSVPKLDLEGNFLSNVSDASRTIEREDDSFEVRLLHRLLQAPLPLLYVFHNFISAKEQQEQQHNAAVAAAPTSTATSGGAKSNQSDAKKKATPPQLLAKNVETDFAVASEDPNTPLMANNSDSSDSDDEEETPTEEGTPRCLAKEMNDEDANHSPEASNPSYPASSATVPQHFQKSNANVAAERLAWKATAITTSRITCRGHGEFLLEDQNGVPRIPSTTEPFARWTIAHSVIRHIFDEAALYAWKMIFSHTIHDAQKQAACSSEEEREARLGRVHQRNSLILACYDCGSEKEWLAQARKNIGFVGKIWTPIKYLEGDSEEDLEERALQSYRFTDDFLLQCFPNAYSLRDVPELLVACGIFRVLKKAITDPLADLSRLAPADPVQVHVHRGKSTQLHVASDLRKPFDAAPQNNNASLSPSPGHSTTSLIDEKFRDVAEKCVLRSLETLVQLQRMADGCFSPTVTTVPSRRAHPLEDDEEVELSNVNGDDDDDEIDAEDREHYDCDDDDDDGYDELPSAVEDRRRQQHHEYNRDDIPDRSDTRLGFIGEDDDGNDDNDDQQHPLSAAGTAPSTTTSNTGGLPHVDDGSAPTTSAAEEDLCDSERDEELARQILLEQPGGPLNTPPEEFSEFPRSGRVEEEDSHADVTALAGTGRGINLPPPQNEDEDDDDSDDATDPFISSIHVTFRSYSTDPPSVTINAPGALESLAERLAMTLTDTRTDAQMLEEI
ncbi:Hypothetical protein, putative [Bodo saltans]|uniref:Uncharacterized protein n=1 Tax=Bodo saltans TaxID=75058 RepID=A0A0S4JW25_BODSA|nr:Hypothetical protein, putative [Bodo saltans]|eukprot:CUG94418.1 Hypothetical protein, putative [Bodo saltans]